MIGLPRILQTTADFEWADKLVAAGVIAPTDLLPHYQGLLAGRYQYVFDHALADSDPEPVATQTPPEWWIQPARVENDGTIPRQVLARTDNPSARAVALGLTWTVIAQRIAKLGAQ